MQKHHLRSTISNSFLFNLKISALFMAYTALLFATPVFAAKAASTSAYSSKKATTSESSIVPVIAGIVKTGVISQQFVTTGDIHPFLGVDIYPKINGEIIKLEVSEGSAVAEGEVIAEIDHRILDAQLEQAQAALVVAQAAVDMQEVMVQTSKSGLNAAKAQADAIRAQVTNLTTSRARLEKLQKEGAISRQQLDDVIAQHDASQAQLRAAVAAVQQAEDNIRSNEMTLKMKKAQLIQAQANLHAVEVQRQDAFIKAPFQGIITQRYLDPGAMANPSQPIVRLEQMHKLKVIGTLVEKNLLMVKPRTTEVVILVDALDKAVKGTVSKIYPAIDPNTRTGQFEVVVDNPDLSLRSGMFAHIKLYIQTKENAVVISRDYLLYHNGEYAAIRVNPEGLAERVQVKTGIIQDNNIEILEGLKAGDIIVTQGMEFVRAGTRVKPIIQEEGKR